MFSLRASCCGNGIEWKANKQPLTSTGLLLQSLQSSSYNHFSAIYYLLLERVREHRAQQLSRQTWTQRPRSTSDTSAPEVRAPGGHALRLAQTFKSSRPGNSIPQPSVFLLIPQLIMDPSEGFRNAPFSIPTTCGHPVYPEMECDQGGLFQVKPQTL